MTGDSTLRCGSLCIMCVMVITALAAPARADEIWVAPTYQADLGGLGISSNVFWPATPIGAVRFAWGVPDNLAAFQGAKVALIPHAAAAGALNVFVCRAGNSEMVGAACSGPLPHVFAGAANQLVEIDIGAAIAAQVGAAGLNYLAVLAYTTPTTTTDHFVGLRFTYAPTGPTLGANVFSGTQTAPAFVGNGSGLTNLPPAAEVGCGSPCIATGEIVDATIVNADISATAAIAPTKIAGTAATLGANSFAGTQSITAGNLGLPATTTAGNGVLTSGGTRFLHRFGTSNTFLGQNAGNFSLTGTRNTAVGLDTLLGTTTGSFNTAVGSGALDTNTTGNNNTATGDLVLLDNTTGHANTASGGQALRSNTSGFGNTASGYQALYFNTTGDFNTAAGYRAGFTANDLNANTTGSQNTFIGYESGPGTTTQLTNATAIGAGALVSQSNALVLGSPNVRVGIGTSFPADKLDVDGDIRVGTGATGCVKDSNGTLIAGTCSSDDRLKRNIEPFGSTLDRVVRLQPVYFDWKADEYPDRHLGHERSFGLIAQDVERWLPELVTDDADGVKAVKYSQLPLLLIQAVKELTAQSQSQAAQIRELLAEVESMKARLP